MVQIYIYALPLGFNGLGKWLVKSFTYGGHDGTKSLVVLATKGRIQLDR
jgi:hypothetical protein